MRPWVRVSFLLAWLMLLSCCSAIGQTASIKGIVYDPAESVVAEAEVMLEQQGKGNPYLLTTDDSGAFEANNLLPGSYSIEVRKDGFAVYRKERLNLNTGRQANLRVVLSLPLYQENVNVGNTEDAKGTTLQESYLSEDSVRHMSDNPDTFREELSAVVGGDAVYRVNGLEIDIHNLPSKDLIRGIRIATGTFSAEYAKQWRFMVDIFTDPSQIKFGGSLTGRGTTTALAAQDRFAPEKVPHDEVTGSASLHGHLGKRLSYGWSLGKSYSNTGKVINAQILDTSLNQVNRRDAVSAGEHETFLELTPSLLLGERDNATTYFRFRKNSEDGQGVGDLSLPEHAFIQRESSYANRLLYNHSFAQSLNNEFSFAYDSDLLRQNPISAKPEILVTGAFTGGGSGVGNTRSNTRSYTIKDVLRVKLTKQVFAIGVEANGHSNDSRLGNNFNGTFTFASLKAYQLTLQGLAAGLSMNKIRALGGGASQFQITTGANNVSSSEPDIAGFIQHDLDLRSNVRISYGLRLEAQKSLQAVNVAPRFSLSWGIDGGPKKPAKTSLQVSLGIFYNRFPLSSVTAVRRYQMYRTAQYTYLNPDFFPDIPEDLQGESSATPSSYGLSSHLHASYYDQRERQSLQKDRERRPSESDVFPFSRAASI